jgi:hypothetical protein
VPVRKDDRVGRPSTPAVIALAAVLLFNLVLLVGAATDRGLGALACCLFGVIANGLLFFVLLGCEPIALRRSEGKWYAAYVVFIFVLPPLGIFFDVTVLPKM